MNSRTSTAAKAHTSWVERNPLRKWRKAADLTQCSVGVAIGRSTQSVRNYESGSHSLTRDSVETIARLLGMKPVDLRGDWNQWLNEGKALPAANHKVGKHTLWVERNPLRKWRKDEFLTQEFIADALGLTKVTVGTHECGKHRPSSESLKVIAKLMEVPAKTLKRRWDRWVRDRPGVGE